ncbi:MAG: radical SAM family heme chaperone HemW [Ruminococcaceae bacterium]|nr:radical SAM family heme chaperone HemW [Oscillospiraceae bacterium]
MRTLEKKTLGLYLHIPFCRSKCLYCDFCSQPNRSESEHAAYTEALCRDLRARAETCSAYTVDSVYVGGGTPTSLAPALLQKILDTVFSCYHIEPHAEITVECNPATESRALFECLVSAGANRLSIGAQSVHDGELRALGRLHCFSDLSKTVSDARAAGFENLSVDVMFGIPLQTEESYLQTLCKLSELQPNHISAYGLTVETGTPFGRMGDRLRLPDEETTRRMYFSGIDLLAQRGFRQYEISNFALDGYESRHNLKYWNCDEYLGFGPAAYSDFGGRRFGNSRDISSYLANEDITEESEVPSPNDRKNEYVMLRMRLSEGIDCRAYQKRFGSSFESDYGDALSRYVNGGFVRKNAQGYAFTTDGMYVSNSILSEILCFDAGNC